MTSLARRMFDPRSAPISRVACVVGLILGVVIASAGFLPGRWGALPGGLAVGAGFGFAVFHLLTAIRSMHQDTRDLWGLAGVMVDGRPWPAPGGWALSARALMVLIAEMRERGSQSVLELGPGVSSVVLGRAVPGLQMVGLEHDEAFVRSVQAQLDAHGLTTYRLLHAPLVACAGVQWYDPAVLGGVPDEVDVLIVDGPPNWRAEGNRAPALKLLGGRLRAGSLVMVDDTARADERRMVERWVSTGQLRVVTDGGEFILLECC